MIVTVILNIEIDKAQIALGFFLGLIFQSLASVKKLIHGIVMVDGDNILEL